MKQNILETIVGFLVIIIAFSFLVFAYKTSNSYKVEKGYIIKANFQNAEGIVSGSDVMISGIKIGEVKRLYLEKESFFAVAELEIHKDIKIPNDSQASIITSGFIGSKFISLSPGASDENFVDGGSIQYTQSSINIESLIGKFMYAK